jgi:hypothetical protein
VTPSGNQLAKRRRRYAAGWFMGLRIGYLVR